MAKKGSVFTWIIQNIFVIITAVIALLNIWFLVQLSPLQSDIRANAQSIDENRVDINRVEDTTIKLMESISSIKSDVSFIRGRLE